MATSIGYTKPVPAELDLSIVSRYYTDPAQGAESTPQQYAADHTLTQFDMGDSLKSLNRLNHPLTCAAGLEVEYAHNWVKDDRPLLQNRSTEQLEPKQADQESACAALLLAICKSFRRPRSGVSNAGIARAPSSCSRSATYRRLAASGEGNQYLVCAGGMQC